MKLNRLIPVRKQQDSRNSQSCSTERDRALNLGARHDHNISYQNRSSRLPNHRSPAIEDESEDEFSDALYKQPGHAATNNTVNLNNNEKTEAELIAEAARRLSVTHEDVVIAVMGLTGTGKSTFIEHLAQTGVKIGHTLASCTSNIGVFPFKHRNGRTIYLVDTLGFNDTTRSDTQVLKQLATFLGALYTKDIKLAGIIYFHRITDNRMGGHALKNLAMFQDLCGKPTLANVVLATTMWDGIQSLEGKEAAERAENELINTPEYWGDMIEEGSKVFRQNDGVKSARRIIDYIMDLDNDGVVPVIAPQMVDDGLTLEKTTAGRRVQKELLEERERHKEELDATRKSMQAAIDRGNERAEKRLREYEKKLMEKQKKHDDDIADMRKDHQKIQAENEAAHRATIERLEKESKQFKAQSTSLKTKLDTLQTKVTDAETTAQNLRSEMDDKDREHKANMKDQKDAFEAKMADWDAETQRLRDERESQSSLGEALGQAVAVFGGAALMGVSAVFLNPAGVAAGTALMSGGGAAIARRLPN